MIFFRNFSIDGLLGDISWDKIRALTETFSSSKMAISIEGKPNAHRDGKCKQLFSIIDILKINAYCAILSVFQAHQIYHRLNKVNVTIQLQFKVRSNICSNHNSSIFKKFLYLMVSYCSFNYIIVFQKWIISTSLKFVLRKTV